MKRYLVIYTLLFSLSAIAQENNSNIIFGRKYTGNEVYRYRLTTYSYFNNQLTAKAVAICELKVVDDGGVPYDEIRWLSKKEYHTDSTDLTKEANAVQPYRISLHPKGKLAIPALNNARMTGEITDFNTFFVAVSPLMGIASLKKTGDSFTKPDVVKGNFANGKDILKGEDCLQVTLTWLAETATDVTVQSAFLPPAQNCLNYFLPEFSTPVAKDTINNFQMVRLYGKGDNFFGVMYGKENFTITSTVRKTDGKIRHAVMENLLLLKGKMQCDEALKNCVITLPAASTIYRKLELELID